MFTIKNEIEFDSAHFLSGYAGKCSNIHGHRYKLVVKVKSEELIAQGQERGMVCDFGVLKSGLKTVSDIFDHKLIVENNKEGIEVYESLNGRYDIVFVDYRPTAEEMSRDIYNRLHKLGLKVSEVELYETSGNSCTYIGE